MSEPRKIEISHRTVVFTVLFIIGVWTLYQIRDIILLFFVSFLVMTILNPIVTRLSRRRIPRGLSVLIAYSFLIFIFGIVIAAIVPTLINQTTAFVSNLPRYLDNLGIFGSYSEQVISQLISQAGTLPSQIAKLLVSVLSNAIAVVAVMIFAFYLLIMRGKIESIWGGFLGDDKVKEINRILSILENRLGGWARGQLSLMFLIWSATYIGLYLLGIPFALPLSILAGLLEVIPNIGPILSAVPAVIIGFGISPFVGATTAALYFLIQQVENYVFVPKVMEKSVGVNPLVTLLALAVGFRLGGIGGMLIAIPLFITLQVFVKEYILEKK